MALSQDYPNFEVIVVDQSLYVPDAVKRLIQAGGRPLNYIQLSSPNLPAARNVGVRAAKGEIIVFIDDDVVIRPDYVSSHAKHFSDPAVGGVTGFTLSANGARPDLESTLKHYGVKQRFADGTALVSWIVGCNASYRSRSIIEAGMCDERFTGTAWCEDVDLAVRVEHAGYKLLFDPQINLTHLELPSGGCGNRTTVNTDRQQDERSRLFLFFVIKNRKVLGSWKLCRSLWHGYRQYACNRRVITKWSRFLQEQRRFLRNLRLAAAMCGEDAAALKSASRSSDFPQ